MAFDFKKEYKELYMPAAEPAIVEVPSMNFLAVRGQGNPNDPEGEYAAAIEMLYGVAYTLKMSYKGDYRIDGFFEYVVPPLEGLWWQPEPGAIDYAHKELFRWISLIRLPDFVARKEFEWAVAEATRRKKRDFSKVEFMPYHEGACVQCMHTGPYDDEPATIGRMQAFAAQQGMKFDISLQRPHHEIYLSDPRRCAPAKLKTVVRLPVMKL